MASTHPEKTSQFEKALLRLRFLIMNGAFEPSTRLAEVAMSERLGISRTPLRQAMAQLAEEGLLERLETGGFRVAGFTMDDIIDAIEIRGVLEGTAARLAAERGVDPELAEECREVLAEIDQLVFEDDQIDFAHYVRLNARFHQCLRGLAGSRVVRREVERAAHLPLASPSAFLQGQDKAPDFRASMRIAQAQHRAIFEAVMSGEGARAEALCREHARLARYNLDHVVHTEPNRAERVPGLALVWPRTPNHRRQREK